jgi:hypothetical protein
MVNAACPDSSLPWSQVRERRSAAGRVVIFAARAAQTVAAEPGRPLGQGRDRAEPVLADDQVAFRKTERGPGGPGVAEVALRSGRLLGMSARLFLGCPDC